ncbi:hypothetical protein [Bradyrhizobium vignae]|uniref:Uncharacterized protein n=1 Tax=Bradyrhizobium vignae TaxID=1549949 RepID=A0ABS4A1T7_9BRAD|nr:hypothetical protein [Bradyrhizobium vignae]MBP0114365.1 hypothetical protein [Bradyrhizobium vignae]
MHLNGEVTYWNHPLKDGDQVQVLRALRGAAPLPPGRRPHAVELLRDFSWRAHELIVVDPYATHAGRQNPSSYATEFIECLNLEGGSVQTLQLIDSSRHHDPDVL